MTSEQLEAARSERMRQNGLGALTFEDARTWIEETGLSLFLPRRQFSPSVAPSFVEAIAGKPTATPDPKLIATAEELLVRLETDGVAVRLNLQGLPGEQPDFVVASWVLPYVYALRGDRDWRRVPQLTGSRQVSQLAVLAYKQLEQGDATISKLRHALGREVTEAAVIRAITELWQQLRIIPVISAPGQAAKWQLLRHRFQKAIAEGASTSQVTAISVLASIYLQAVIAATMEEVEAFLSPLTSRSKIREVLRGLVATRQVHTISLGHAPHYYVAGTLPEFAPATSIYAGAYLSSSPYFQHQREHEDELSSAHNLPAVSAQAGAPPKPHASVEPHPHRAASHKPATAAKPAAPRPHMSMSRPVPHSRDHKSAHGTTGSRPMRRSAEGRSSETRPAIGSRSTSKSRWAKPASKNGKVQNGHHGKTAGNGVRSNGTSLNAGGAGRTIAGSKPAGSAWKSRTGGPNGKAAAKGGPGRHPGKPVRGTATRKEGGAVHAKRKPAVAASARGGNSKRYGFTAPSKAGSKKRG